MSTRGQVMLVVDGHYYGFYQHHDMYPSGHPSTLFEEAATLTEQDGWDDIVVGFLTKSWVCDWEDRKRSSLIDTIATEKSPTLGCFKPDNTKTDDKHTVSFKSAAEMPVMCREDLWSSSDTEYAVIADLDANKIVCVDTSLSNVILAADLADPDAIRAESAKGSVAHNHDDLKALPHKAWRPDVQELWRIHETAPFLNGQWNRPPKFPAFEGTPPDYPAKEYTCEAHARLAEAHPPASMPDTSPYNSQAQCTHVGKISKARCRRNVHQDRHHRYS